MRRLLIYVDVSVIGGCEDSEFAEASLALWQRFVDGTHTLALSAHTLRELVHAPAAVRARVDRVPADHVLNLERGYPLIEIRTPREVLEYE